MSSLPLHVGFPVREVVEWYLRGIDSQDLILSIKLPTGIYYKLKECCYGMSMKCLISCGEKVEVKLFKAGPVPGQCARLICMLQDARTP